MTDLHPQAHKLLAYADNTLDEVERIKVEKLLEADNSAVSFLEQLTISELPFKDAFDSLLELDPPLLEKTELDNTDNSPIHRTIQTDHPSNQNKWLWPTSLVASLLLGASLMFFNLNTNIEDHDNWIVQVADYHLLYIRETVRHSHSGPEEIEKLSYHLGKQLNSKLTIPNLSKQNLSFRRGQILDSNGRKLVQLAYLPKKGRPVALCILKNNVNDRLPKTGKSRGLHYVTWSKNGLSYIIIGAIDKNDLNAAALNALSQMDNNG